MKIEAYKADKLSAFLKNPRAVSRSVLIYGPDNGMVRERSRLVSQAIVGQQPDPFARAEFTGEQLKQDSARLMDELCAMSLLGDVRIVVVSQPPEKLEPVITSAMDSVKNTNYLIIEADDLGSGSGLRKLYESHMQLAALPCYLPDAANVKQFIRSHLQSQRIRITPDALQYLGENLGNDQMITRNELDKIILYMGQETEVTVKIAAALVGDDANDSADILCQAVALGNYAHADTIMTRLLREGVTPIVLIRALLNYFRRLDMALYHMAQGETVDNAIKMLRPPVFFKAVDSMKQAISRLSPAKVTQALNLLLHAEKSSKSGVMAVELVIGQLLVTLATIR